MPKINSFQCLVEMIKTKKVYVTKVKRPKGYLEKEGWRPYPFNYGYIEGLINPFNRENIDVVILNYPPLTRNDEVEIKPIGMLVRDDKKNKIIGIKPGSKITKQQLLLVESWYNEWFSGISLELWDEKFD